MRQYLFSKKLILLLLVIFINYIIIGFVYNKPKTITVLKGNLRYIKDNLSIHNWQSINLSRGNSLITVSDCKKEQLLILVNEARLKENLEPLELDDSLSVVANKKAEDMLNNKYFAHVSEKYGTPFAMMQKAGINYSLAGENLARARTVNRAFQLLMDSPQHRKNILTKGFDKIGIAVIDRGFLGLLIVQMFIASPNYV